MAPKQPLKGTKSRRPRLKGKENSSPTLGDSDASRISIAGSKHSWQLMDEPAEASGIPGHNKKLKGTLEHTSMDLTEVEEASLNWLQLDQ